MCYELRVRGFFCSVSCVLFACSSSSSSPTGDTAPTDGGTTTPGDAKPGTSNPTPTNPDTLACLGTSAAITIDSGRPFADVVVAGQSGKFLVDYATTESDIDLSKFGTAPTATECDPTKLGQACKFASLDFIGDFGKVTLFTTTHTKSQAGIIATDLLAASAFTIDFKNAKAYRATSLCDDATLGANGFTALDSTGYFASNVGKLRPLTDVDSNASSGSTVPNVPSVPIEIAGAHAIAQLDTGFADSVTPYSLNVNEAFFATIPGGALDRAASKDLSLSTCAGVSEKVEAYTLKSGATLKVGPHEFPQTIVFVKKTPQAAKSCGGIGTYTVPAAQIGASFFVAGGAWIFDAASERVWVQNP